MLGLNVAPVTPGPENVPPPGEPDKLTDPELVHCAAMGEIDGVGVFVIVTVVDAVKAAHPPEAGIL